VRNLITMGYSAHLPAMSGIGYRQIASCIEGGTTLDTAVHQIQVETHRFVRRQYNWFRLNDARISWFDVRDIEMEVKVSTKVAEFVGQYT
jgi:tRNA dimethylallyltransferase